MRITSVSYTHLDVYKRQVKYGCTRDYVRAMTVVLPTGEIVKLGATVSKTSSGYSLLNLMIGSEGTLGIITELTLKVIPAPKSVISLIIPYENLEDCIATVPVSYTHLFNFIDHGRIYRKISCLCRNLYSLFLSFGRMCDPSMEWKQRRTKRNGIPKRIRKTEKFCLRISPWNRRNDSVWTR